MSITPVSNVPTTSSANMKSTSIVDGLSVGWALACGLAGGMGARIGNTIGSIFQAPVRGAVLGFLIGAAVPPLVNALYFQKTAAPSLLATAPKLTLQQYRNKINRIETNIDERRNGTKGKGLTHLNNQSDLIFGLENELYNCYREMNDHYPGQITPEETEKFRQCEVRRHDLDSNIKWIPANKALSESLDRSKEQQKLETSVSAKPYFVYQQRQQLPLSEHEDHRQADRSTNRLYYKLEQRIVGEDLVVTAHAQGDRDVAHGCMQDADTRNEEHILINGHNYTLTLNGIFDGHGTDGDKASLFFSRLLLQKITEKLNHAILHSNSLQEEKIKDHVIYNALRSSLIEISYLYPGVGGSTACVEIDFQEFRWIVNTGDARAFLISGSAKTITQLSEDAKPTDPSIQADIQARGGAVSNGRIGGKLAVGRSLGDRGVKGLNPAPNSITKTKIEEGDITVIGCDGMFDCARTDSLGQAVIDNMGRRGIDKVAADLLYSVWQSGSTDNLSIQIKRKATPAEKANYNNLLTKYRK